MFLWVEKYRPHTIEECVLPDDTKQVFLELYDKVDVDFNLNTGDNDESMERV